MILDDSLLKVLFPENFASEINADRFPGENHAELATKNDMWKGKILFIDRFPMGL